MTDTAGKPFNPLDQGNLAQSVVNALLEQEVWPLANVPAIDGAGLYAVYYSGTLPIYEKLVEKNAEGRFSAPIYVGKAENPGRRKGQFHEATGPALQRRLREHRDSVAAAENLDVTHFHCRYLVVEPLFIPLGENLLIGRFQPIWNTLVDGFGNHDPGRGRHQGVVSRWDALHPGRSWASSLQPRPEKVALIEEDVREYLRQRS